MIVLDNAFAIPNIGYVCLLRSFLALVGATTVWYCIWEMFLKEKLGSIKLHISWYTFLPRNNLPGILVV